MNAFTKILSGCLTVSAAGMLWLYLSHHQATISEEPDPMMCRSRALPVPDPAPAPVVYSCKPSVAPEPEVMKEPVQPIEERNDAMLFEIEALGAMPFDESIVFPFD
jgi:hypothetical protein